LVASSIGPRWPPLQRGFATGATDTGHTGDGSTWAIASPPGLSQSVVNERIIDYAWRAVHELANTAKLLIKAYYGYPQSHAYYNGCSDGGREGLKDAQMFSNDFDGILIGGTAAYWTHAGIQQLWLTQQMVVTGMDGTPGADKLTAAQDAAVEACAD
jgi:feruloyl esterase